MMSRSHSQGTEVTIVTGAFCVFTLFWLSNEGTIHSFNYGKINALFGKQRDFLLTIKHGRNVV